MGVDGGVDEGQGNKKMGNFDVPWQMLEKASLRICRKGQGVVRTGKGVPATACHVVA
jgi:hypothetical protein